MTGDNFSGKFLDCLINVTIYCMQSGIQFAISRKQSPIVYYARNMCLGGDVLRGENQKPFDGKVDYSHLMWIDRDIIFTPQQFQKLLSYDKDIVSGVYMMGNQIHLATVENWDEEYFKKNGSFKFLTPKDIEDKTQLIKVAYTGLGFMLVKKGVFESIEYPWFRPIFYTLGDAKDFCSEDTAFCQLAIKNGYNIYISPQIRVGHEKNVVL